MKETKKMMIWLTDECMTLEEDLNSISKSAAKGGDAVNISDSKNNIMSKAGDDTKDGKGTGTGTGTGTRTRGDLTPSSAAAAAEPLDGMSVVLLT